MLGAKVVHNLSLCYGVDHDLQTRLFGPGILWIIIFWLLKKDNPPY